MITARRIANNKCDALLMCVNPFCPRISTMTVCIHLSYSSAFFATKKKQYKIVCLELWTQNI